MEKNFPPIMAQADVVIAGGGPGGIGAALAAARTGAKTILLERLYALGGMMTMGLMHGIGISPVIKGIPWEIIRRLESMGAALMGDWPQGMALPVGFPLIPIDPEMTKWLLDEMMHEANIQVILGSPVVGAISEGKTIKAVITENKSGRTAVTGKVFIDATGDGDLAARAGASFEFGRPEDGLTSAATLLFRIGNVNLGKLLASIENHPEDLHNNSPEDVNQLRDALRSKPQKFARFGNFLPLIERVMRLHDFTEWERSILMRRNGLTFFNTPSPKEVLVNTTRIGPINATNALEVSDAMVEGRRQAKFLFDFMKANLPGFENAYFQDTAAQLGVRESRRICGDYSFGEKDVLGFARFADVVVRNTDGIEIHNPVGNGYQFVKLEPQQWYEVPYRSLIAKDFSNCLLAGRCYSATHIGLGAGRGIGFCMGMGQAAGFAAGLACMQDISIREVNVKEIQKLAGIE